MTKMRMNTELRNKLFGKMKDVFENEITQERVAYIDAKKKVDTQYVKAFNIARNIVERAYPSDDVAILQSFKKRYGEAVDVVAKDKCFYFAHSEGVDEDGDKVETKSHFDFGLFGNLNGTEYSSEDGKKFAFAYMRDELKNLNCNPDILAQQEGKDNNPHKTKHENENCNALGNGQTYGSNSNSGISKNFNSSYELDVIGTSYCRSRAIACTRNEYEQLDEWRTAKAHLVSCHQTWVDSISQQSDQLKIGLKAYRYLSEGIELATELGIELDEADLLRTNSTGLSIYNPSNLANMIKSMKNKSKSREAKILERKQYETVLN
jgi:hypothetical protein